MNFIIFVSFWWTLVKNCCPTQHIIYIHKGISNNNVVWVLEYIDFMRQSLEKANSAIYIQNHDKIYSKALVRKIFFNSFIMSCPSDNAYLYFLKKKKMSELAKGFSDMGDSSLSVHFHVPILWHSTDGKFVVLPYFLKPIYLYQIHFW